MSEIKYKTGWIKDPEGNKFAPITTTDQVITSDGADLASEINNIKNDVTTLNSNINEIINNGVVSNGQVAVYRRGNVVTLVFNAANVASDTIGWQTVLCTVPSIYAPKYEFYFGGTDEKVYYMFSDGRVVCTTSLTSGDGLYAIVTYVVND